MLVSIIIPCYNVAPWLARALDSALGQTYPYTEIICVDNNSTDETWSILQRYAQSYPEKIRLLQESKQGAPAARNRGLKAAKGEWIQFLDADDFIAETKLEQQLSSLENTISEDIITTCKWEFFDSNIEYIESNTNRLIDKSYVRPEEWLIDSWLGQSSGMIAIWLIPKKIITSYWHEELLINQDGVFFAKIILSANKIVFTNEVLAFYRRPRGNNISQRKDYLAMKSLLNSFVIYYNLVRDSESEQIRIACATNFLNYIYKYHVKYPDLTDQARIYLENLKIRPSKLPIVGGGRFRLFSYLLGFDMALKLKWLLGATWNKMRVLFSSKDGFNV